MYDWIKPAKRGLYHEGFRVEPLCSTVRGKPPGIDISSFSYRCADIATPPGDPLAETPASRLWTAVLNGIGSAALTPRERRELLVTLTLTIRLS